MIYIESTDMILGTHLTFVYKVHHHHLLCQLWLYNTVLGYGEV